MYKSLTYIVRFSIIKLQTRDQGSDSGIIFVNDNIILIIKTKTKNG
jgi:hypothetical protein